MIQQEFTELVGLKHIKVSFCNKTAEETRLFFQEKITNSISPSNKNRLASLACVLDELFTLGFCHLHVAFDQFASKNTCSWQYRSQVFTEADQAPGFIEELVIIDWDNELYMLLLERPLDNLPLCRCLANIIACEFNRSRGKAFPGLVLRSAAPFLFKVLSTAKKHYIMPLMDRASRPSYNRPHAGLVLFVSCVKKTIFSFIADVERRKLVILNMKVRF
jgi:hypothetical protein